MVKVRGLDEALLVDCVELTAANLVLYPPFKPPVMIILSDDAVSDVSDENVSMILARPVPLQEAMACGAAAGLKVVMVVVVFGAG